MTDTHGRNTMTDTATSPALPVPLLLPGVSIGHHCSDCYQIAVTPEYVNTAGPSYKPVVTFTGTHGAVREGKDGTLVDADGEAVTAVCIDLDDVPDLIIRLQAYVDAQRAAGDSMVNGWRVG